MKFSYNWLKDFLPSLPPPKETANLLTLHAFEVSGFRRESGDWMFDIDVLPNRMADASSHEGVARELVAILTVQKGKKFALREAQPRLREDPWIRTASLLRVKIEDREGCPLYGARVVTGVRVRPSPSWLQKRLRIVGIESINNLVDATNYVMLEIGQPLHAFDLDRIAEPRRTPNQNKYGSGQAKRGTMQKLIIVRKAKRGEKITTLDGETRRLPEFTTVIADSEKPLAIAGIKGGETAAITAKTTAIVLESALFSSTNIYRTAKALRIATDASKRFEAGRSPNDVLRALDRAAELIVRVAEGRVVQARILVGNANSAARVIPFSLSYAQKLLGMELSEGRARKALKAIGCRTVFKKSVWIVTPPARRTDLEREEDLIEEVGRLIGYDIIPSILPAAPLRVEESSNTHVWVDRCRDMLAAHGFSETMRLSMVNEKFLSGWGVASRSLAEIENPQSSDATHLRPTLLPRLLAQAYEERRKTEVVRLFEVGNIFSQGKKKIEEGLACGVVLARSAPGGKSVFYELKGVLEDLCEQFGLTDVAWRAPKKSQRLFHPGRMSEILVNGKRVGNVGELHPRLLRAHPALGAVAAAEFDLGVLSTLASDEHEYREPSRYPEVARDIAVLVPLKTRADDVNQEIVEAGKALIRDVELFDYFEGEGIPEAMKSLAFRIFYQATDRTLTSAEIDSLHERIEASLRRHGWEIR